MFVHQHIRRYVHRKGTVDHVAGDHAGKPPI
jgi:hypothetical protein